VATELNNVPFNIERYPPLRENRYREVASLAMAHQTLRSTVVRLSPLLCYRTGIPDPCVLSGRTPVYSILTFSFIHSARRGSRSATVLMRLVIGLRSFGHEGAASAAYKAISKSDFR
jgi:hypothetical protein